MIKRLFVVNGYFLIIGGGKFGRIAFEHFKKQKNSLILVVDKDPSFANTLGLPILTNISQILKIIKTFNKNNLNQLKNEQQSYFIKKDLTKEQKDLHFLIKEFIPEWIIPVTPIHVVAVIYQNLIYEYGFQSKIPNYHFEDLLSEIPQDLVLSFNSDNGIINLSYAKESERCPEDCYGPEKFCSYFGKPKNFSLTEIVMMLKDKIYGIIFESKQIKGGLGGIQGLDFKRNSESLFGLLDNPDKNFFFIATTCNCHGVINAFFHESKEK